MLTTNERMQSESMHEQYRWGGINKHKCTVAKLITNYY